MCGLCGLLGGDQHWITKEENPLPRRQQRYLVVRAANEVLSHYGLKLGDFQGSAYVLSTLTGRQEVVQDIGAVWMNAQLMSRRPLDPLDPGLLDALEEAARGQR